VQNILPSSLLSKNIKIKIHRIIILSFDLYGCETWFLTLSEEHRVTMFDNRMLKRVFGPWRDEETGVEKTTKRGAYYLYSILNIIRVVKSRMKWAGHVEFIWERRHI